MGACLSAGPVAAEEVPRCRVCGATAPAPWGQLDAVQRAAWTRDRSTVCCRKCLLAAKVERIKHQKEREAYKQAKEAMYPKPSKLGRPLLHRVRSGEEWKDTHSFGQGWRPSDTLRSLMQSIFEAQREDPKLHVGIQRKPCGFVPPTAEYLRRASPAQRAQLHAAASAVVCAELARCSGGSVASSAAGEQRREYLLECQAKLAVLVEGCSSGAAAEVHEQPQLRHADSTWSTGACVHGRCSLSRRAASVAAQAVAEVAFDAAQREAAAAAAREAGEAREAAEAAAVEAAAAGPAPLTPIAESEGEGDAASWQRRRVLWQMHHQKSRVFGPDGCSPEALGELLDGGSEDGSGSCGSLAALGDSASSMDRRGPPCKCAVQGSEIEPAPLEAPHPAAAIRC